jgi:hypothetical protein
MDTGVSVDMPSISVAVSEPIDPRVEKWKAFFALLDQWRADPDGPDTPSATGVALLHDELLMDTIGSIADDPVVAQVRSLIPLAEEFIDKRGAAGTHDAAIELIERGFAIMRDLGILDAVQHVFYAAVRGANVDKDKLPENTRVENDAAGAAGLLRGSAALHDIVTSRTLGPRLGQLLSIDARLQAAGDESLIGRKVRNRKRQNKLGSLLDDIRGLSVLRARYEAARAGCGWQAEHERLFPGAAAAETIREWNKHIDLELRNLASSVGLKAGRQEPLDDREQALEEVALRYPTEDITKGLAELGVQK